MEAEKATIVKFANEDLLLELVELADNFELAFQNQAGWESVPENWRKGVEYIYSKLTNLFRRFNLEEINPRGEHFEPARCHSLMSVDTHKKEEDNIVLEVVQKGYILNGRLVRPAQVKVGHLISKP
jgi:molecular chaperone GrpE